MKSLQKSLVAGVGLVCLVGAGGLLRQASGIGHAGVPADSSTRALSLPLDSMDGLEVQSIQESGVNPVNAKAEVAAYRGHRAAHVVNNDGLTATGASAGGQTIAIVKASAFKNGTIEADIVGMPRDGAPPDTRGFIGIAFRVQDSNKRFECFYLRFTNGRADDQLRRNHATQYVSEPDYPWQRLRKENPGEYESYVDIEPGAWTHVKIAVAGMKAQLFVNGAAQPCLIVNDLKLGDSQGRVALWTGSDTEAYFSNLSVK